jgi:hypothetical protein
MSFFIAREVQRSNYDGRVIQEHKRWNRYLPFEFMLRWREHGQAQEKRSGR